MTPTLTIRRATPADLDMVSALESAAFPPAEAASREAYAARLAAFADRYWLLFADGALVSLVGGSLSHEANLRDEMFADASLHAPGGRVQMIFSVATRPDCQGRGYATRLLVRMLADCRDEGLAAVVLTCKPEKRSFYARVGFVDEGVSPSEHGGALWHQMRVRF